MKDRFVVGLVGAPFGLEGLVKVRSLSGEIEHLLKLRRVVLRLGGGEQVRGVEKSVPVFPGVAMKFGGIDSPEEARSLAGAEIVVPREEASPLKKGEFYIEDLKGLSVASGTGKVLGCITGIIEGGGGFLAEIRLDSGETRLVPFRDEFFGEINAERVVLRGVWILE